MKKLLTILLLFCAVSSIAQLPITQNLGSDSTLIRIGNNSKGALRGSLIPSTYTDTTQANAGRIDDYPFAIIATSGDGNTWQRNYLATGWVLIGGGSDPSGLFFKVGGNLFPVTVPSRNIGTLAPYGGAIGLMTNSVVHAIVPDAGFTLANDTTAAKVFTWNPTSKEWGYANWNNGGGATPTLQQVLTAGSTLTTNNTINVGGYNFTISNSGQIEIFSTEGGNVVTGALNRSAITVGDNILIYPHLGSLIIDTLNAFGDTINWKPLVYRQSTGEVKKATYWPGGGGGGSSSINLNSKKALYFPGGTTESHVLHGYYFVEDFEFGDGLFEAWIRPQGGQYVISDGYGGVHAWLFGITAANDSMFTLAGNVWYGGTNTGLLSKDLIKKNTAHHIAVGLSGGYLVTYIDGVPSWKLAWPYGRKNWAAAGAGQCFIGGSDHQLYEGTIFSVRMWEDKNPFSIDGPTYVQQSFRGDEPYVSLMADYTNWQNSTFEDHSAGLFGVKHPGVIHHSQAVYSPAPIVSTDSLPHFIADSIFKSPYVGAITSNPSGCKIFDAFERTDEVPAFDLPNIDTTQSGTLGRKPYTFGNGGWSSGIYAGIINTYCYFSYLGGGNNFVTVTGDSGDQDVRVTSSTTASEQKVIAIARYTDENNRIYASQEGGSVQLYKFVGGSFTALGGYSGSSFSELRLVVSGSNATVYCDGVSRITSSSVGDVPSTGHGSGFGSSSSFTRIKKFEVY